MRGAGIAVNAAMLAPPVRIYGILKAYVFAVVLGKYGARLILIKDCFGSGLFFIVINFVALVKINIQLFKSILRIKIRSPSFNTPVLSLFLVTALRLS